MTKLRKTTTIYAPIEKLFDFIEDGGKNLQLYAGGVSRVKELSRSKVRVGDRLTLTYSVMGMHFDEQLTYVQYERPRLLVSGIAGPITGTFRITLEQEANNQTMTTLEVEYEIGGAIGRAANKLLLERLNGKNLDIMLSKIKKIVEVRQFGKGKEEKAIALSQS
jgi:carbon monoxide dehydrogenase subunit G